MYIFLLASLCILVSCPEHINKSPSSKHIFEDKQQKAADNRVKAAHEEQERSWATNAMGMHIGIDDVEADESFKGQLETSAETTSLIRCFAEVGI